MFIIILIKLLFKNLRILKFLLFSKIQQCLLNADIWGKIFQIRITYLRSK